MIDIHSHILPGIDDGPRTMEESLQMVRMASECGVQTIVATPHCNLEGVFDNYYGSMLEDRFRDFAEAVKREQIPVRVVLGMEVYGTESVPALLYKGRLISIHRSKYLLMEFKFKEDLSLTEFLIEEVVNQGFRPVIAHPERYPYVQKFPDIVYDWISKGCYLQVNKDSILGDFGHRAKSTAMFLLDRNLVSFVASDAHDLLHRTTELSEVYSYLKDYFSEGYADLLLKENPRHLLEDLELVKQHFVHLQ
ncbi:MAG TPA: CpsB/CapC family capsule biosynthesis tyrosine phosphatase [Mobilitalea sp.]|nr:CpsB/CapC family capsule biosynthesis tyrosine phosphatase [Mobilitalea sp.]